MLIAEKTMIIQYNAFQVGTSTIFRKLKKQTYMVANKYRTKLPKCALLLISVAISLENKAFKLLKLTKIELFLIRFVVIAKLNL